MSCLGRISNLQWKMYPWGFPSTFSHLMIFKVWGPLGCGSTGDIAQCPAPVSVLSAWLQMRHPCVQSQLPPPRHRQGDNTQFNSHIIY